MNQKQKQQFQKILDTTNLPEVFKFGPALTSEEKEKNHKAIKDILQKIGCSTTLDHFADAAKLVEAMRKKTPKELQGLSFQAPLADGDATKKLQNLKADSSTVTEMLAGVDVRLDVDQLKHQHPTKPIGSRAKGGGNRFKNICDATWHINNTMNHMAAWANELGNMAEGDTKYHGQATPVNGIHYEGYCLYAMGRKYVSFHCYPADDNKELLLQ